MDSMSMSDADAAMSGIEMPGSGTEAEVDASGTEAVPPEDAPPEAVPPVVTQASPAGSGVAMEVDLAAEVGIPTGAEKAVRDFLAKIGPKPSSQVMSVDQLQALADSPEEENVRGGTRSGVGDAKKKKKAAKKTGKGPSKSRTTGKAKAKRAASDAQANQLTVGQLATLARVVAPVLRNLPDMLGHRMPADLGEELRFKGLGMDMGRIDSVSAHQLVDFVRSSTFDVFRGYISFFANVLDHDYEPASEDDEEQEAPGPAEDPDFYDSSSGFDSQVEMTDEDVYESLYLDRETGAPLPQIGSLTLSKKGKSKKASASQAVSSGKKKAAPVASSTQQQSDKSKGKGKARKQAGPKTVDSSGKVKESAKESAKKHAKTKASVSKNKGRSAAMGDYNSSEEESGSSSDSYSGSSSSGSSSSGSSSSAESSSGESSSRSG